MRVVLWSLAAQIPPEKEQLFGSDESARGLDGWLQVPQMGRKEIIPSRHHYLLGSQLLWLLWKQGRRHPTCQLRDESEVV